ELTSAAVVGFAGKATAKPSSGRSKPTGFGNTPEPSKTIPSAKVSKAPAVIKPEVLPEKPSLAPGDAEILEGLPGAVINGIKQADSYSTVISSMGITETLFIYLKAS
ncbi:MAG: hypothetical protein AAGB19_01190, partial [Cyanobacteria bacterium P01_F01_bin.3]